METYALSALLVALAEVGDRTQLLAIMLAGRYRRPVPILLGIAAGTLANHVLAALLGYYFGQLLQSGWFRAAVSFSFVAMAVWALIPDKPGEEAGPGPLRLGVFVTTAVAFFLVEMGDKTQVATLALAARFRNVALVATGATTGMILANLPAVLLGQAMTRALPLKALRTAAALLYLALGLTGLAAAAGWVR